MNVFLRSDAPPGVADAGQPPTPFHVRHLSTGNRGVELPGETGETFDFGSYMVSPGVHTLSVTVVDDTPMMRNEIDCANGMTETRTWALLGIRAAPGIRGVVTR